MAFAAATGWEYNLVDAGRSATWMPELVRYARGRGVGIFAGFTVQSWPATPGAASCSTP